MIECIYCRCGTLFAACVDGSQDEEWNKNKSIYRRAGCKVKIVESCDFRGLGSCSCDVTTPLVTGQANCEEILEAIAGYQNALDLSVQFSEQREGGDATSVAPK